MDGRRDRVRGAVAALAVTVLVAACGGSDDGETAATTAAEEQGPPVAVESVGSVGADPFTEGVQVDEVADFPDAVSATAAAVVAQGTDDQGTGGVRVVGDAPGLYGSRQDARACDVGQLVDVLTDGADAEKAAAFARVLGIAPSAIADTLATYTPVVLTADTLVTNHGYRDGQATPFPAVLEAGTAVLVDTLGIPRVKCSCGNPLGDPPGTVDLTRTEGDVWDGYDPGSTVTVGSASAPLQELTLTDLVTGDTFRQPVGSGDTVAPPSSTVPPPATAVPPPATTVPPPATTVPPPPPDPGGTPIDVRNATLPPGACSDRGGEVLTMVDGEAQGGLVEGSVNGATVEGEPIQDDVDGDGSIDVTFALSCYSCGASCADFSSVLTVEAGPAGELVLVAALRGADGVPTAPDTLTLQGGVLTVAGLEFGPGDAEVTGPRQPVSASFRFAGGEWVPA